MSEGEQRSSEPCQRDMKKITPALVAVLVLMGACGGPDGPGGVSGGSMGGGSDDSISTGPSPGGGSGGGSGDSVSSPPSPGHDLDSGGAQMVVARPGMAAVHPVSWQKAKVRNPHIFEIIYWSGVEPCHVLDHATVTPSDDHVAVTLFEGSDPAQADAACIEIAAKKSVLVDLKAPLDGRRVVDGKRKMAR